MPTASPRRAHRAKVRSVSPAELSRSRAGRNLPAAIAVGVGLGAVIVGALLLWKPAFMIAVTAAVVLGAWELIEALRSGRIQAPVLPTMVAAVTLVPVAYYAGADGLAIGFALSALTILVWRALSGLDGAVRDIAGGVFITAYVPVLAGITSLMLAEPDGVGRIFVFLITTVASDVGGYAVGVFAGRHPMAPSVSPKKSWEGFAGSVLSCMLAGALTVALLLGGPSWAGLAIGAAVALFATVGDLAESTIKRDLGIKDMGSLLPGHGGVMDRLDSMLVTAPVTWALLIVLVP